MFLYRFRRYMRLPQELRPAEIFKQDSLSPSKIAVQIILLQLFYYATAIILFGVSSKLFGYEITSVKDWLFNSSMVDFSNVFGLTYSILWLLDSVICCFFLSVIVGRSKLAWDFAITIHAINLMCTLLYTHQLPKFSWWFIQILSSLILIFLGTTMSRWRELRETFFDDLLEPNTSTAVRENNVSIPQETELKDLEAQV